MTHPTPGPAQGIVQSVEYTHGGIGNQWTTIDGVRYATFWDIRTRDWNEGDKVAFTWVMHSLWDGAAPMPIARELRRIPRAAIGADQYGIQILLPRALDAEGVAQLQQALLAAQQDCVGGGFEIEVLPRATAVTFIRDPQADAPLIQRNLATGRLHAQTAQAAALAQMAAELWDHDSDCILLADLHTILEDNDAVKPLVINPEALGAAAGLALAT